MKKAKVLIQMSVIAEIEVDEDLMEEIDENGGEPSRNQCWELAMDAMEQQSVRNALLTNEPNDVDFEGWVED